MKKVYKLEINFYEDYSKKIGGKQMLTEEAFTFEYIGKRVFSTSNWSYGDESVNDLLKECINTPLTEISGTDIQDKVIYRYPKLTLPRAKVDVLKEKYNISITRNKDIADYHIFSTKWLNNIIVRHYWGTVGTKNDFRNLIVELENASDLTTPAIEYLEKLYAQVEDDSLISFNDNYSYNSAHPARKRYTDLEKRVKEANEKSDEAKYPWIVGAESVELLEKLLGDHNPVLDTALGKLTTEDSHILTQDDYKNILSMLASSDVQNRTLAVEMMANCNIEESFDLLALVFWFQNHTIKYASNWNTVNVKAMRARLTQFADGCYNQQAAHCYDNFLQKLCKEKSLTEFALKTTIKKMFDSVIKNSMGFTAESIFDFSIDQIKLKPEWQEKVKVGTADLFMRSPILAGCEDDLPF